MSAQDPTPATTLTRRGRIYMATRPFSGTPVNYDIDAVAVGTGTKARSINDTKLDNEVGERIAINDTPLNFKPYTPNPYYVRVNLNLGGNREVPPGTKVTEMGVFADGIPAPDGSMPGRNIMVLRATGGAVTMNEGVVLPFWVLHGHPLVAPENTEAEELQAVASAYEAVTGEPITVTESMAVETTGGTGPDFETAETNAADTEGGI